MMTAEIDQIKNILAVVFPTYTINANDANLAPALAVEIDSVNNPTALSRDQIYRIIMRATSEANLVTAIETLLKLDSQHVDGYASYTDTEETEYEFSPLTNARAVQADSKFLYSPKGDQSMGWIGETVDRGFSTFLGLDAVDLSNIVSAKIAFTPNQDYEFGVSINVLVYSDPDYDDLTENFSSEDLTQESLVYGTSTTVLGTTWTADLEIELPNDGGVTTSTLAEVLAQTPTILRIDGGATDNTATFTFDFTSVLLTITRNFTNTDYPHHLEIKYKYRNIDNPNEFVAEFEILARWAI